ncbi:hypothetical protein Mapa_004853 [Marchantia paleacea]|nr:hypothetical protein Mapa_004853 [Marchantia paleacea]
MNLSQRYRNTEEHECQFRVSACARKQFFNRPNEVEGQCWSGGRFCSQPVQMPSFRKPPSLPVGKMQIACLNVSTIAARFPMPTPTRSSAIWMSNQPSVAQIRRPVILFDVMDTIVRDPFHDRMPAYFGLVAPPYCLPKLVYWDCVVRNPNTPTVCTIGVTCMHSLIPTKLETCIWRSNFAVSIVWSPVLSMMENQVGWLAAWFSNTELQVTQSRESMQRQSCRGQGTSVMSEGKLQGS